MIHFSSCFSFPLLLGSAPESPSPCEHNWETAENPPSPDGFGGGNIQSVSERAFFYCWRYFFLLQFNGISAGGLGPAVPSADRQENIPAFYSCCFHLVMSLSAISSSWNGHGVTTPGAQRPKAAFLMALGGKRGGMWVGPGLMGRKRQCCTWWYFLGVLWLSLGL